jgi:hypothetical protein
LHKIPKADRPTITANAKTRTIRVGRVHKLVFRTEKMFALAKEYLLVA